MKLSEAAKRLPPEPDGYPGFRQQLKSAKNALVFGPEGRAPHAIFLACRRLYQAKLHNRFEEAGAFGIERRTKREVLDEIRAFNEGLHLPQHERLPYLYGSWKAKKQAFRWIAGTSRVQDEQAQVQSEEDGPPKNALSELGRGYDQGVAEGDSNIAHKGH